MVPGDLVRKVVLGGCRKFWSGQLLYPRPLELVRGVSILITRGGGMVLTQSEHRMDCFSLR